MKMRDKIAMSLAILLTTEEDFDYIDVVDRDGCKRRNLCIQITKINDGKFCVTPHYFESDDDPNESQPYLEGETMYLHYDDGIIDTIEKFAYQFVDDIDADDSIPDGAKAKGE